ncbi:response regulator receiver protein [Russula earlei]|uniref:Response regulator receiver protein n=1 Tax=Russula earlei TaxID=71964 RepID=A0ACC0TSC6_9AGAM|nr:response regulator receiver protein [Russula earlei]
MRKPFILVAEDDSDDKFLLQAIFEERGYDTPLEFVSNGVELIEYLGNIQLDEENANYPAFILLDLNMPKMDGRQALKQIKEHAVLKKIPVVVFSTTKNDIEIKRCYELGANTYIVKPSNFESLANAIDRIRNYWLHIAARPA